MKRNSDITRIRQLIWLYFWLLIFEGALRKWIIPSAANVLLVVRDPIVITIYLFSLRSGLFPRNSFVVFAGLLGLLTIMVSSFADDGNMIVTLYGARTNFLQLPFIFLIPKVFDARDVHKIGFYVLLMSIPIALLMVIQFRSDAGAWINAGAEANFNQIESAGGHIRPPGLFSFISGPVVFYSLALAFLLDSQFTSKRYPSWLLLGALLSLFAAAAVSGSRSFVAGISIVCLFALFYGLFNLQVKIRWVYSVALLTIISFSLLRIPIFQEAINIFNMRIQGASRFEGGASGFSDRALSGFTAIFPLAGKVPAQGHGLGVGTIAGSIILTGKPQFLLAEGEWERIVMESGPALGMGFIFYRVALALWLGWISFKLPPQREALPFLLLGSCCFNLLNGQFGQSTLLGFTIFISGLCIAATRLARQNLIQPVPRTQERRLRAYAVSP